MFGSKMNFFGTIVIFTVVVSSLAILTDLGTPRIERKDYSDVYEKIDENDIFKNVRRIIREGDPANGVPVLAPLVRTHRATTENELGDIENQRIENLDQFITKHALVYSNKEKFEFNLLWPKVSFLSRHSSTYNSRVFYSNYTFTGCTLKGDADVTLTGRDGCFRLRDIKVTLHFDNFQVTVVTPSNARADKDAAALAKQTLIDFIRQENTLGLERIAYELEGKIKEYFTSYRCIVKEEPEEERTPAPPVTLGSRFTYRV